MAWLKNIFSQKTETDNHDKKELLLQNINHSISENTLKIKKLNNEIEQIKKWIAEVIHDNFHVLGDFWYEELAHFNEIKAAKENKEVDTETINKCEELIKEYQSQIKFRKTKVELTEMTIVKYEESKQKILDLDSKESIDIETPEEQSDSFKKHQNRLNELSKNPENTNIGQSTKNELENIIEKVNELIENQEIEEEVQSFMKKLNEQFSTEMKNYDQARLINEMEKLIEQYKTDK